MNSLFAGIRRNKKSSLAIAILAGAYFYSKRNSNSKKSQDQRLGGQLASVNKSTSTGNNSKSKTKKGAAIDALFLKRLIHLTKIVVPTYQGTETGMLSLLGLLLIARTWMSGYTSEIAGRNANHMVNRDWWKYFLGTFGDVFIFGMPASLTNSLIKLFTNKLAIRFRENLVRKAHDDYFASNTFYRLNSGGVLENVDHRLTSDIEKFTSSLAFLYVAMIKPFCDIYYFSRKIAAFGGYKGPSTMIAYFFASAIFLRSIQPNFAKLTATTQHYEGVFRANHTRVQNHAEEITFVGGAPREHEILERNLSNLLDHHLYLYRRQAIQGVVDEFIVKYSATFVGFSIVGRPVFAKDTPFTSVSQRTGHYFRTNQLLMSLAKALGQLVMLYKNITALSGYTTRVSQLFETLEEVKSKATDAGSASSISQDSELISMSGVSIYSPDGDLLIGDLGFEVRPGQGLMIFGPNGCGKSSIFRALAGLWPVPTGSITRPPSDAVFFVPQKPYLFPSSLREQIIYPHTLETMRAGVTDEDLWEILRWAQMETTVTSHGGLDSVKNWSSNYLSGGEKQRLGMARLYYHKPTFALLDECTSAVDISVDDSLYERATLLGITLVTISHRKSLWKHHKNVLLIDDESKTAKFQAVPKEAYEKYSGDMSKEFVLPSI